jgi:hypothetical protein
MRGAKRARNAGAGRLIVLLALFQAHVATIQVRVAKAPVWKRRCRALGEFALHRRGRVRRAVPRNTIKRARTAFDFALALELVAGHAFEKYMCAQKILPILADHQRNQVVLVAARAVADTVWHGLHIAHLTHGRALGIVTIYTHMSVTTIAANVSGRHLWAKFERETFQIFGHGVKNFHWIACQRTQPYQVQD